MAVRQCRLIQYWPADRQVRSTRRESLAFTRRMEIRRASAVAPVYCNVLSGDLVNLVLPVLLCLGHAAVNGRRSFFVYLPYLQTNELSRAQNSISDPRIYQLGVPQYSAVFYSLGPTNN